MNTKISKLNIPSEVLQAIDEFINQIVNKLGDKIDSIRLYGSVIKGFIS